MTPHLIYYFRV